MTRLVTINFSKDKFSFSAGHFTIFSKTHRECLHGHNYYVAAEVTAPISEPGITFDYKIFSQKLLAVCDRLNSRFLLAKSSPYLRIVENTETVDVFFNSEKIPFLRKDIILLPITNTTIEELSHWFLGQLIADQKFIKAYHIVKILIKLYNGHDHYAQASWQELSTSAN